MPNGAMQQIKNLLLGSTALQTIYPLIVNEPPRPRIDWKGLQKLLTPPARRG